MMHEKHSYNLFSVYGYALRKIFKRMKYTRQDRIKMDLTSFNDFINDSNFGTIRVAVTLYSDRVI